MKLLVTCPGKMGDLLYSLPLVMQLKKKFACDVYLSTSTYCAPVINLLNAQPYIKKAFIDPGYRIAHTEFCVQPWRMSEPSGYDKIFHLGLREELVSEEVMKQHLIESFFLNMERGYGLKLPCNPENPYLFLVKPTPKEDYIVFNGYGKTLREYTPVEFFNYVEFFFKELLNLVGREVKVVTGPDERDRYDWLKAEVICPGDLEETARLISGAACFVGVGSAAAAVANGLKAPRLILDWFGTDKPTGERGKTFTLDESSKAVAQRLSTLLTY